MAIALSAALLAAWSERFWAPIAASSIFKPLHGLSFIEKLIWASSPTIRRSSNGPFLWWSERFCAANIAPWLSHGAKRCWRWLGSISRHDPGPRACLSVVDSAACWLEIDCISHQSIGMPRRSARKLTSVRQWPRCRHMPDGSPRQDDPSVSAPPAPACKPSPAPSPELSEATGCGSRDLGKVNFVLSWTACPSSYWTWKH